MGCVFSLCDAFAAVVSSYWISFVIGFSFSFFSSFPSFHIICVRFGLVNANAGGCMSLGELRMKEFGISALH